MPKIDTSKLSAYVYVRENNKIVSKPRSFSPDIINSRIVFFINDGIQEIEVYFCDICKSYHHIETKGKCK